VIFFKYVMGVMSVMRGSMEVVN